VFQLKKGLSLRASQSKRSILTLIKADLSMINPDKAWTHQ
jgi:hypothetical protein